MTTLAELLQNMGRYIPPAQRTDPVLAPSNPENYDPLSRRTVVGNLAAQGEDARQRQRLAPDAADKLRAMAAGGLDMLRVPSAAIGVFDPDLRDHIRATADSHEGMGRAGAMLVPAGLAGILLRSPAKGAMYGMTSALYDTPDVLDALSAKRFPKAKNDE